jgi:WD40 repeat protein
MLALRNRHLGFVCIVAWIGTGLALWMWRTPLPRSRPLHGISKVGKPLFLSRDGHYLATVKEASFPRYPQPGDAPATISLWDIDTGVEQFQVKERRAANVTFSADGTLVAIVTLDNEIKVWNSKTGEMQLLRTPDFCPYYGGAGHCPNGANFAAFSPNGDVYAVGGRFETRGPLKEDVGGLPDFSDRPGGIRLWDLAHKKEIAALPIPHSFGGMGFSPDGRRLAVVQEYPLKAQLFDLDTAKAGLVIDTGTIHNGEWQQLVFAPDGHTLAIMEPTRQIFLSDTASGQERRFWLLGGKHGAAAFSPDSRLLAVSCSGVGSEMRKVVHGLDAKLAYRLFPPTDCTLLLDAQTGDAVESLPSSAYLAFRPDGTLVTYSAKNDAIFLWNVPPRPGLWIRALPLAMALLLTATWWYRGGRIWRRKA